MREHLADLDQATFRQLRVTGRGQLAQVVWLYERPLDQPGLKAFHQNFGYGLAGRRIERSPLPFARHRWVSARGPAGDLDIADEPRPRAGLSDWLDERAELPIDPERGPGWHLGVLPMTDGSAAVSLVGSHCLFDGLGMLRTIAEAVDGTVRELGYSMPNSRKPGRAVVEDIRQTVRDVPAVGRALATAAKLLRQRTPTPATSKESHPVLSGGTENVVVPAVTVFVDIDDWDGAAHRLGGNSHSLLAGFSAQLAARVGRCRPTDGKVPLLIAISDRTVDDTRANALRFAGADVDPVGANIDLSPARAAIRRAVQDVRTLPDETLAVLPLARFLPKRVVRRSSAMLFGDLPVSCSNLGDVDPAVSRVDGTEADYVMLRPVDQNVRRGEIEYGGGQLVVAAGRVAGRMSIGVVAYQPGASNTKPRLRALAVEVLAAFGLSGEFV